MIGKNFGQRLKRLEASLTPNDQDVIIIQVRASATGEIMERFTVNGRHRGQRTTARIWQTDSEDNQQTT